jgi:enediyne biosynthesis protein E4
VPFLRIAVPLLAALAGVAATAAPPQSRPQSPQKPPPASQEVFADRTRESGVDFTHQNGMTGAFYMPEIMGPGVALFDYDNDGDLDLFLVQGGPLGPKAAAAPGVGHVLYRNDLRKGPDGRMEAHFTDVTAESGITRGGYAMGVAVGDYDNDGWPDLLITGLDGTHLWHNNGRGGPGGAGKVTFTEVTAKAGVTDPAWSVSAAFFDYDRDGWLDLYVGNYLKFSFASAKPCRTPAGAADWCGPIPADAQPSRLFHNRGDGTFEDVTVKSGVAAEFGPALGVITADFDGDGWIDFYVANDATQNQLWRNQRNGTFRNDGLIAGCAVNADGKAQASMGIDAGDYDGDGDEDLVMDNLTGEGDTLYKNDGTGMFEDVTLASGIYRPSLPYTGFGAAWLDYDNDGWLDLLTVNGAVRSIEEQAHAGSALPLRQGKQLFHNLGNGKFEDVTAAAGVVLARPEISRGAAFGDIDNDGDTDVVVVNNNGPAVVLINQVGSRKPWLGLRLLTGKPGRDAVGARVGIVRAGAPTLWRRSRADGSYASANDPRVLVGLGEKAEVTKVIVKWPSGRVEEWKGGTGLPVNAYTTLREGTGTAVP